MDRGNEQPNEHYREDVEKPEAKYTVMTPLYLRECHKSQEARVQ
jgi:hypothetical protein